MQRELLVFKGLKKRKPRRRVQQPLASGRLPRLQRPGKLVASDQFDEQLINSDMDLNSALGDSMEGV